MALAEIERDGFGDRLPDLVDRARQAVAPLPFDFLTDRLSTMQLAMTQGWSEAKAFAWLGETRRLLADVPGDVLLESLDEAIRQSARGFMPSVGEIMAIAQPAIERRRTTLARLEAVERLKAGAAAVLPAPGGFDPATRCSPEEAAAVKAEFGIHTPTRMAKPAPATEADYIAIGLSPEEARKAVADHARLLSAGAAPIGATAKRGGRGRDDFFREIGADPDNPTDEQIAAVTERVLAMGRKKWAADPVEPRLTDEEQREAEADMAAYDRRLTA